MNSGEAERLWKLQTSANALVLEDKRDPGTLLEFLQKFVFGSDLSGEVWAKVYEYLGMSAEYADFAKSNPVLDNPSLWTVPVLKGVTRNKVVVALRKLGVNMYLYAEDLDTEIPINDRDPSRDGSYAVSFRKNVEADEEFKNLSANDLKNRDHKGITLLERLLLELGYFLATGKHLDEKNWTLCTGSRNRDGNVPSVNWDPGYRGVDVDWYSPDRFSGSLRSRSVVS